MIVAVDLSQITFPNYVTGVKLYGGDFFKGGYNYFTNYGGWTTKTLVREHERFTGLPEISELGTDYVYITEWTTFYKAPNGYEFQFQITQKVTGYTSYSVRVLNNLGEVVQGSIPGITLHNNNYNAGVLIRWTRYAFDVYMTTVYAPDVDPIDGSPNHGLVLSISMGDAEDEQNPYNFHVGTLYGSEIHALPLSGTLISFSNIAAFEQYMKNNGEPFDGDIFTDAPLPDDPAGSDDPSAPGGGGGNYDDTSDPIDFPDLPTGGALESGAVIAHRVSKQTLEAIMLKLWDGSIFNILNMWQKSISDPMDAIVSLHCLPVSPTVNGQSDIWIGNFDTELQSPVVTSQYVEVDCGTLDVKEYWGSALDYSPYTRAEIYLPFIGVKDVSIEDVMNSTLHIKYHIDILTGDCIAFIKCGMSVLYHFTGNCRMTIPLSSYSTDALQNTIGATGKMLSSAAIGAAVGGGAGAFAGTAISSAATVASSKIRLSKGDGLSGGTSLMDDFVPYLILHRPVQSLAKDYNKFKGYPSNITSVLGNLSGYTEVEHIHLQDIPNATSAEMEEIKSLLKNGVLL